MTIVLNGELEVRLKEAAQRKGVEPREYVAEVLRKDLGEPNGYIGPPEEFGYLQRTLSPEEWIQSAEAWIASHKDWPTLPDSALQREDWYGERG